MYDSVAYHKEYYRQTRQRVKSCPICGTMTTRSKYCSKDCYKASLKLAYEERKASGKTKEYDARRKETESGKSRFAIYYQANKDVLKSKKKEKYQQNIEKEREKARLRAKQSRHKIRQYRRKRYATDPAYKLEVNLRNRIKKVIKKNNKSDKANVLLGCTVSFLRDYIESKFTKGMSWDNYGKVWHIDHIIPCSKFDLSLPDQQKQCFHYSNLRPLSASENIKKKAKIVIGLNQLSLTI